MSARQGRLDKLYAGLTARERAILVLQAWKRDEDEDPQVRLTMPESQGAEFNYCIDLMNGVHDLTPYVIVVHQQAAQLGLKFAWLSTFHLWGLHTSTLAEYICFDTKEPITESAHKRRVEEARSKATPIAELAEVLVERYDGWTEDDLQASEDDEEPEVSDKAWNRVLAQKKKELARLIDQGVLEGTRKGRRLLINVGSFYDWLGQPAPVFPDWGVEFEVFPDEQADEVDRLRRARRCAQDELRRGPSDAVLHLLGGTAADDSKPAKKNRHRIDEVIDALHTTLREMVPARWRELRTAEVVLEEVAAEFDGEDPLHPRVRDALDEARQELEELVEKVQRRVGAFSLPEPDEEELATLRKTAKLAAGD